MKAQRWCTQTPYAKVADNGRFWYTTRKFSLLTYVYEIEDTYNGIPTTTFYPSTPGNVAISYGYYYGQPTWSVEARLPIDTLDALGATMAVNPVSLGTIPIVRLNVGKPDEYWVGITDVLGRAFGEPGYSLGEIPAGVVSIPLFVQNVPPGRYFCRIAGRMTGASTTVSFLIVP